MNTRAFWLSTLVSGVAIAIFGNLPVFNLINCALCVWVWIGGALSVGLYRRFHGDRPVVSAGQGAGLGALSGLIGAVLGAGVFLITSPLSVPMFNTLARALELENGWAVHARHEGRGPDSLLPRAGLPDVALRGPGGAARGSPLPPAMPRDAMLARQILTASLVVALPGTLAVGAVTLYVLLTLGAVDVQLTEITQSLHATRELQLAVGRAERHLSNRALARGPTPGPGEFDRSIAAAETHLASCASAPCHGASQTPR